MWLQCAFTVLALFLITVRDAACSLDYDDGDYMRWNYTGEDNHGRPIYVPDRGPRRKIGFAQRDTREARAWSVQTQDDGVDNPGTTPPTRGRKGMLNRRFSVAGSSGRAAPAGQDSHSCPGGVCPNPDLYGDEPYSAGGADFDPYYEDRHYDPKYPYDNCHYVGGFHDFKLNGTEACHLQVQGANGHADLLTGGLDGIYLLAGCFEGKPIYIRSRYSGPPGEDRVLYYNPEFGAWEFSVGREPSADQLVLAGDDGYVSPVDVSRWHLASVFNSLLASELSSDDEDLFYAAAGISVMYIGQSDESLLSSTPPKQRMHPPGSVSGKEAAKKDGEITTGKGSGKGSGKGPGSARSKAGVRPGKGKSGAAVEEEEEAEAEAVGRVPLHGHGRDNGGGDDAVPSQQDLEHEVREVRVYWQRHEEEFEEMHLPYGEMPMQVAYDYLYGDPYGGPEGYDDGYGYDMY